MLTNKNSFKVVSLFYEKKNLNSPVHALPNLSTIFKSNQSVLNKSFGREFSHFFLSKVLNYMVKIWSCEEELFHHKVHNDIKDVERLPPEFEKKLKSGSPFIYQKAGTG